MSKRRRRRRRRSRRRKRRPGKGEGAGPVVLPQILRDQSYGSKSSVCTITRSHKPKFPKFSLDLLLIKGERQRFQGENRTI